MTLFFLVVERGTSVVLDVMRCRGVMVGWGDAGGVS